MVGTRTGDEKLLYPAAEVAQRHGAAAKEETPNPREAYADYERARPGRPEGWDTLPWAGGG